ncbi:MAG: nitroreductase family protein [Lachnospiraceae bacterium]|jgi:nitroreductase|nr:nitroreductase family protein [Lachnospiraceae bacterium]
MYNSFLDLAKERYSVRKYSEKKIPSELLDKVLEAGKLAPTACNNQPQKIMVIDTPEGFEKLKKSTPYTFGAPAMLIICYDKDEAWESPFNGQTSGYVDASIVTTHMILEATELGFGTCWVMYFDPAVLSKEFNLSENLVPVALLPIGYPAEDAKPAKMHEDRKDIHKTVI